MNAPAALIWLKPIPTWNNMVLGGHSLIQTYTVCNVTTEPVTVKSIDFRLSHEARVRLAGGTCTPGVVLGPKTCGTVHVEIEPKTLGMVEQHLQIQHTGSGSLLQSRIAFSVKEHIAPSSRGKKNAGSILAEETRRMGRQQRLAEQEGHRKLAKLHAREHNLDPQQESSPALEGELQNSILQNPWLNSQRFDGIDPNLNPEPPLNSEARREFDNERREQEMEKQLRLGNMPKFSMAPKPQGQF